MNKVTRIETPFDLFSVMSKLSEIEQKILALTYREGRITFDQICRLGNSQDNVQSTIQNLIEKNLLYKYKFHNFEFYELNLRMTRSLTYERFPSGPVIPLIYHFNLLSNESRVESFRRAIQKVVKPGDIVFDLGCGTGILSIFAAQQGAYVFAVEVDPLVAEAAEYFIKNSGFSSKIKVIQGDVRELSLGREADVIICEMLDTALIAELQVPVMNYAVKNLLKPNGRVIPESAVTSAQLVNVDYTFTGLEFKLIHYEAHSARIANTELSLPMPYHKIFLNKENEIYFDGKFSIVTTRDGVVNSLRLVTETQLTDGIYEIGKPWFNPPLILPIKDLLVKRGERVEIKLSYKLGGGFTSIKYEINGGRND